MKKVIGYAFVAAIAAAAGYGVGTTEGETLKEKTIGFGLKVVSKVKEVAGKYFPKCETEEVVDQPAAPEGE